MDVFQSVEPAHELALEKFVDPLHLVAVFLADGSRIDVEIDDEPVTFAAVPACVVGDDLLETFHQDHFCCLAGRMIWRSRQKRLSR